MEADSRLAVAKDVSTLLASAGRVRAAGIVCLVEGKWLTVHVNLTVLHEGMPEPQPLELEREGICAFDVLIDAGGLEHLLAGLDEHGVRLPVFGRVASVPGVSHSYGPRFMERKYAQRDYRVDWPCDQLTIQGGGYQCSLLQQRFQRFIEALPAMDPPIAGRVALARELGLFGDVSVDRGGGHLYFFRPLPVRIEHVGGTGMLNEIEIRVEAFGALPATFAMSVMPDGGRRSAMRLRAGDFALMPSSNSIWSKRVVLQQTGPVKVSLVARDGEVADEAEAGTPWAPALVHEQFDPGFRQLRLRLFGSDEKGQKDSRQFEIGVAWLLHLCGCATMHLDGSEGKSQLLGSPDIVARTPNDDVMVAECSLRIPASDKLGKLVERAQSVAAVLARAGVPSGVRTVFFVGEDYSGAIQGIEFVDRSRLIRIVERLRSGRPDGLCWP